MDKTLIIDGTNHVAGKLAAFIAKKLLRGYSITVLAVENVRFTGPLHRHIGKYKSFKEKRSPYNPERGAFHWSEPSKYFKNKLFRGMVPRKTKRGTCAINGLTCYEGIPKQFEGAERVVVPKALFEVTTSGDRKSCTLGEVLSHFGWAHADLAKSLTEELRKREEIASEAAANNQAKTEQKIRDEKFMHKVDRKLAEYA